MTVHSICSPLKEKVALNFSKQEQYSNNIFHHFSKIFHIDQISFNISI